MPLELKDINWLAHLARISLNDEEKIAALEQINHFFTSVEKIQAIDTQKVMPLAHPLTITYSLVQHLRPDEITESNQPVHRDTYQSCSPMTADGFYLVPRVVE